MLLKESDILYITIMKPQQKSTKGKFERVLLILAVSIGSAVVIWIISFFAAINSEQAKFDESAKRNKEYLSKIVIFEGRQAEVTADADVDTLTNSGTYAETKYDTSDTLINLQNQMASSIKTYGYSFTQTYEISSAYTDGNFGFYPDNIISIIKTHATAGTEALSISYILEEPYNCGRVCDKSIIEARGLLNYPVKRVEVSRYDQAR